MSREFPPPKKKTHTHILLHTVSCNLLYGVNTDLICSTQPVNSNTYMKTEVKRWYSNYEMRTLKCSEHNLFFCHFIYYKTRTDRPGNETASPRWEAGVEQTEQSDERYNLLYGVSIVACRYNLLYGVSIVACRYNLLYGVSIVACRYNLLHESVRIHT
jgi:hypothetical protein